MAYSPLTDQDRALMLSEIGVANFDQLIQAVPAKLHYPELNLPDSLSEIELRAHIESLLNQNRTAHQYNSFLGAGSYDHYVPSVVRHVISRGEFYTAYTPYQPEASQGTLQAIFEYQSLVAELTGMDISNGSHYDGATSFAEGCLLALNTTQRRKILVARNLSPEYRAVLETYLASAGFDMVQIPFTAEGLLDMNFLRQELNEEVGCVAAANPNFFGLVEDFSALEKSVHDNGSLLLLTGHPLAFAVFRSPGEWGADIACGEAQPLGLPMNFGGPYVGYFTTTKALMRRIPGRLAGLTKDKEGRRAFVLTLQAREQHIRREKATSNICTNQALCALAVCVYLASLGQKGIKAVAELNVEKANSLRDKISGLNNFSLPFQAPLFNEFVVKSDKPLAALLPELQKKGILAGYDLGRDYPELKDHLLITVTENKTEEDMLALIDALKQG